MNIFQLLVDRHLLHEFLVKLSSKLLGVVFYSKLPKELLLKTVNFMILYGVSRFRGSKVDANIGAQPRLRIFRNVQGKT
jgi:hypothetical protein